MSNFATDCVKEVSNGKFIRTDSLCRDFISTSHSIYKPEFNRYHLYISLACPWANRCSSIIYMKGLKDCIGITCVHPTWQRTRPNINEDRHCGWAFAKPNEILTSSEGKGNFAISSCDEDSLNNAKFVRDLYDISGNSANKFTVPILWDKKTKSIVNNESSEILIMLNSVFNEWATIKTIDYYPLELKEQIDNMNDWIYKDINNGVYKCGFAQTQEAYMEAVTELYNGLDRLECILSNNRYTIGNSVTLVDIRLFMTLIRFDEVYIVYFKCNKRRISDYPNIYQYVRDMYQLPNMKESISMEHIKMHYFSSHPSLNPFSIIPVGSDVISDLLLPHNRADK